VSMNSTVNVFQQALTESRAMHMDLILCIISLLWRHTGPSLPWLRIRIPSRIATGGLGDEHLKFSNIKFFFFFLMDFFLVWAVGVSIEAICFILYITKDFSVGTTKFSTVAMDFYEKRLCMMWFLKQMFLIHLYTLLCSMASNFFDLQMQILRLCTATEFSQWLCAF
jgi:hypothetical protein